MTATPERVTPTALNARPAPPRPDSPDGGQAHLDRGQLRILSILAGGAAGALARAGVAQALPQHGGSWPWATFIVNLVGALLLGWLLTRLAERIAPTQHWRTLLGTGFCGALTTFSTFQVDTIRLARSGHPGVAVTYVTLSLLLGVLCAVAGTVAARWGRYR